MGDALVTQESLLSAAQRIAQFKEGTSATLRALVDLMTKLFQCVTVQFVSVLCLVFVGAKTFLHQAVSGKLMTGRSERGMKICYPTPSKEFAKAVLLDDAFSSGLKLAWVRPEEMIVASFARIEHA